MSAQILFLKPEEIAEEFDINENKIWRKLELGEWTAVTLCEIFDFDGKRVSFDRARVNAEVVRLLIGQPAQEIEFTNRHGLRRIVAAGKENIEVIVGPKFTPELFSPNITSSTNDDEASTDAETTPTRTTRIERASDSRVQRKTMTISEIAAIDWPIPSNGPRKFRDVIADTPKWMVEARVLRGAPGKGGSLWDPVIFAVCLATHSRGKSWRSNKAALNNLFKNELAEFKDEWEAKSKLL